MNSSSIETAADDPSGEIELRGDDLDGAERKRSVRNSEHLAKRDPDAVLHVDGEEDTLYSDGLEVEDDSLTLADTHGKDK